MTSEAVYLFVYGTLRRAAGHPAHGLLAQGSELIGPAHMNGRMYEIDGYPGVVPCASENAQVVGELYRLLEPAALLAALDAYEEAGDNFPEPQEYRRCRVTVERAGGERLKAWVFLYNRSTADLRLIADGNWCG